MESGIYSIYCKVTDKYYVGQSIEIEERLNHHKSRLRNGKHKIRDLQRDFDKYGEDNFIFKVEKYIEPQFLSSLETHFIEFYDSVNKGYNINNANVVLRKEDKEKQLAKNTLKHIEDLEEISIPLNVEDAKIVLLNYYNMCLVESMYRDEYKEEGCANSNSLNHYIVRSLTYDNSAISRYEVLFSKFVTKYLNGKYKGVKIDGCEIVKVANTEPNYRGIYIGYINNLIMCNTVKIGITYSSIVSDDKYYKELDLLLVNNGVEMLWNVKKGL